MSGEKTQADNISEIERRAEATLKRLLATPPDHKRAAKPNASPKQSAKPRGKTLVGNPEK